MRCKGFFNKRAQSTMSLPFNWIFALILIIVFVLAAVYAINSFLDAGKCSRVGMYYDSLQKKVDEAYQSSSSRFEIEIDLPGVDKICFANLSAPITGNLEDYEAISIYDFYDANTFLIPPEDSCNIPYKNIKHLDVKNTTKSQNPYCIPTTEKLVLIKDTYDRAVVIA